MEGNAGAFPGLGLKRFSVQDNNAEITWTHLLHGHTNTPNLYLSTNSCFWEKKLRTDWTVSPQQKMKRSYGKRQSQERWRHVDTGMATTDGVNYREDGYYWEVMSKFICHGAQKKKICDLKELPEYKRFCPIIPPNKEKDTNSLQVRGPSKYNSLCSPSTLIRWSGALSICVL